MVRFIEHYCTSKRQHQESYPLSHTPRTPTDVRARSARRSDRHLLVLTCTQAITEQTSVQDVAHWISIFTLRRLQVFEAFVF